MSLTNGSGRITRAIPAAAFSSLMVAGGVTIGWVYDLRVDMEEKVGRITERVRANEERVLNVDAMSRMRYEQQEEEQGEAMRLLRAIRAEQANIRGAQDNIRRKQEEILDKIKRHIEAE